VITAAIAAGTTPAHAVTQQQIAWCENKGGAFSFDLEVSGCTAAIESGKWSGKNLAWAFSNRCNAKNEVNNYDGAIADCSQAIQLNPKSPNFFNGRCWGRAVLERDLTAALADCDESLWLRPDDGNTLNSRGLVQFKLGALD
jgi:tetratricopeptide (TPR) repeat protein